MENQSGTPVSQVDFSIEDHFSLVLFRMNTPAAHAWVSDNVQDNAQFFGDALVVEPRYARDLAAGIIEAGLAVV
jgi:hypothetical protein